MIDRSTRICYHVNAAREKVYRALIDADAITKWKFPLGMTCVVHSFEGYEGGTFRISLTYDESAEIGKTSEHTDTYHGRFVKLVANEQVVEADEFETEDPGLQGEMTISITLSDADGGTDIFAMHDGLPPKLSATDNESGWRMALAKLADLLEGG